MSVTRIAKTLLAALAFSAAARAQTATVVYETSTNYSGKFNQSTNECGDEIILFGNKSVITQIQIEYFGSFVPNGDEIARMRFYANTGPAWKGNQSYKTPASPPLWETTFPVSIGFNTATITVPYIKVPLQFTWTVQFFGIDMTTTNYAGLLIYGDPLTGSSYNDYWELKDGSWLPQRYNTVPKNNFAAKILAVDAAPSAPSVSAAIDGGNVRLSWPSTAAGFYLESRTNLTTGYWEPVMPLALQVGNLFQTTVPTSAGTRIFRLNNNPQLPLNVIAQAAAVKLRWSAAIGGQTLQTRSSIDSAWIDLPTPSRPVGDFYEVNATTTSSNQFFRLIKKL